MRPDVNCQITAGLLASRYLRASVLTPGPTIASPRSRPKSFNYTCSWKPGRMGTNQNRNCSGRQRSPAVLASSHRVDRDGDRAGDGGRSVTALAIGPPPPCQPLRLTAQRGFVGAMLACLWVKQFHHDSNFVPCWNHPV